MEWFVAHAWLAATVSNPSDQSSPDGLAANAVVYGLGNLGPSWVGESPLTADVATDAIRPSSAVFVLVCDASDDSEITLRRGTRASPGTLVTTFAKCWPANVWIGFSEVTADTSSWVLSIDDPSGTVSDPATVEVKFFGIAPRVALFSAAGASIGRPAQTRTPADLSTHAQSQLGADFAAEQPTLHTQAMQVYAHDDETALGLLRRAIHAVKTVRPILSCTDKDTATSYGNTVLGRLPALPVEQVEPGMMVGFALSVVEML